MDDFVSRFMCILFIICATFIGTIFLHLDDLYVLSDLDSKNQLINPKKILILEKYRLQEKIDKLEENNG